MSDATADTKEMRAAGDTIPSSAPPERKSLVYFAPGSGVHEIEDDIPAIEAAERASATSMAPAAQQPPPPRGALEAISDHLAKINEHTRMLAVTAKSLDAKAQSQAEVTAHIANEVTCMRMLERGSRETNELDGIVVLLVEDQPEVLTTIRRQLQNMGATVYWCDSELGARLRLAKIGNGKIDCAILDMVLPDEIGTGLGQRIRRDRPDCGLVFMSGYGMQEYREQADKLGAQLLPKPFSIEALRNAVLEAATRNA